MEWTKIQTSAVILFGWFIFLFVVFGTMWSYGNRNERKRRKKK